jgi:hypothetical protein
MILAHLVFSLIETYKKFMPISWILLMFLFVPVHTSALRISIGLKYPICSVVLRYSGICPFVLSVLL